MSEADKLFEEVGIKSMNIIFLKKVKNQNQMNGLHRMNHILNI